MLATYHNHSTWSDGKASIPQIIPVARSLGVAELGISDHWVLHPTGRQPTWAMPTGQLDRYIREITQLRDEVQNENSSRSAMTLRLGLEVDWHPGRASNLLAALKPFAFDYLIGSVHEVGEFAIDMSPASWAKLTQDQRNEIHRQYWINMRSLAASGVFDIAAHIDLPKKFAFYPTTDLSCEIGAALDAVAAAKLVVELNTSGWHKPCADGYPTLDILKQCRQRDIRVTINADAHQPEHLLRDFGKAAERLAAAGYDEVARFERRQIRMEPLSAAF
jgi:histidinol-phosphatase (PHP family)